MNSDISIELSALLESRDVPKPLRILLKSGDRGKHWTALSTQYSVHARAATAGEAVLRLLNNLTNYMASCKRDQIPLISYASEIFLEAFDFGEAIDPSILNLGSNVEETKKLDIRGPKKLAKLLSSKDVEIRRAPKELEELIPA